MSRLPKRRKKKIQKQTYWLTEAGGDATYFGSVADMSYEDAKQAFSSHLASLGGERDDRKWAALAAGDLYPGDGAGVPGPVRPVLRSRA